MAALRPLSRRLQTLPHVHIPNEAQGVDGQRLGMRGLRLDALYCLVLGISLTVMSSTIEAAIALPVPLIVVAGVAVVLWAGLVEWMSATLNLRLALRIVMVANIAATCTVALVSLTAAAVVAVLVILAVAAEIAVFAGVQALALGRLRAA